MTAHESTWQHDSTTGLARVLHHNKGAVAEPNDAGVRGARHWCLPVAAEAEAPWHPEADRRNRRCNAGSISSRSECHPSDCAPPSYRLSRQTLKWTRTPVRCASQRSTRPFTSVSPRVHGWTVLEAYPTL